MRTLLFKFLYLYSRFVIIRLFSVLNGVEEITESARKSCEQNLKIRKNIR